RPAYRSCLRAHRSADQPRMSVTRRLVRRLSSSTLLCSGALMILGLALAITVGPDMVAHDPYALDLAAALQSPGLAHWLGPDDRGRDTLARIIVAGRIDVQIAIICVALPFVVGSVIGAVAGYFGGLLDAAIMRVVDILWAFPFYVLVIAIIGTLGPGLPN